ncbi:2'-5' RNA ligase family protein [Seonamhaeicola marinus]|uniref:Mutarotase n=1 Tax=Seonamhaeicola marinus TaxID=1912246 RepID=A0A5D0IPX2_9FLAO|nr:mutarotase [Seonamhaeicola marinus]TYA84377.1 mutarotase [Seonamhaeicola marinus]
MSLKTHYDLLFNDAVESIKNDTYSIDSLIESPSDKRFGITLLARPPIEIKEAIQEFLNEVKIVEPKQYYYNNTDIHITVMSIISCYNGFQLQHVNIEDYIHLINESLKTITSFKISFEGITAASSGLMIQGFMEDNTLNLVRNNLRKTFKTSHLEQSIDKRYTIQTAHATVLRFKAPLNNKSEFLKLIERYRTHNFGTFEVDNLELVFNDWYQRKKFVKKLHKFNLY